MNSFVNELSRLWSMFVGWLPLLISAIIAYVVGWIIALILKSITYSILHAVNLNRRIERSKTEDVVHRLTNDPSTSIANFVYYIAMTIVVLTAVSYLKIPAINDFIVRIYSYIPNLVGAVFILAVALAISGSISALVTRWMGQSVTGKIIATLIPTVILSVAGFAILEQLNVAPVIISTTYIAIIGTLALSSAIAFGLGGRRVAERILDAAYEQGSKRIGQVRRDIAEGTSRARSDAAMVQAHERPRKRKKF